MGLSDEERAGRHDGGRDRAGAEGVIVPVVVQVVGAERAGDIDAPEDSRSGDDGGRVAAAPMHIAPEDGPVVSLRSIGESSAVGGAFFELLGFDDWFFVGGCERPKTVQHREALTAFGKDVDQAVGGQDAFGPASAGAAGDLIGDVLVGFPVGEAHAAVNEEAFGGDGRIAVEELRAAREGAEAFRAALQAVKQGEIARLVIMCHFVDGHLVIDEECAGIFVMAHGRGVFVIADGFAGGGGQEVDDVAFFLDEIQAQEFWDGEAAGFKNHGVAATGRTITRLGPGDSFLFP